MDELTPRVGRWRGLRGGGQNPGTGRRIHSGMTWRIQWSALEAGGFRRFSLRGLGSAAGEWQLVCAVHNVGKLFRSGQAGKVLPGWNPPAAPRSAWCPWP